MDTRCVSLWKALSQDCVRSTRLRTETAERGLAQWSCLRRARARKVIDAHQGASPRVALGSVARYGSVSLGSLVQDREEPQEGIEAIGFPWFSDPVGRAVRYPFR